jgi:hypothetical protein
VPPSVFDLRNSIHIVCCPVRQVPLFPTGQEQVYIFLIFCQPFHQQIRKEGCRGRHKRNHQRTETQSNPAGQTAQLVPVHVHEAEKTEDTDAAFLADDP